MFLASYMIYFYNYWGLALEECSWTDSYVRMDWNFLALGDFLVWIFGLEVLFRMG